MGSGPVVDAGYARRPRAEHGADEFANDRSRINGIERFWSHAKGRIAQQHMPGNPDLRSIFAVMVARMPSLMWRVPRRLSQLAGE